MYKLIRYFNQNRRKILTIVISIAFGLILLRFANYIARIENENFQKNALANQNKTVVKNNINTQSAITGQEGSINNTKETDILEQFIEFCNQGKIEDAYNLLSSDCKKKMYSTLEKFKETYYKDNFKESKTYNIQRWAGSTYKVDLKENMLHTGKVTSESKQDFITVIYEEKNYKLNINNYIGRKDLNKQTIIDNVVITVVCKDIFMNYENYILEVKNNNDKDIYLDNLKDSSTIYIVDENNVKHEAYTHEIVEPQVHIYSHTSKEVEIKFSNKYITGKSYSKIVFENVIFDENTNETKVISINI